MRKTFISLLIKWFWVLYFGKILHCYNFRKSECFRLMSSGTDSLTIVSHLNVGGLLRFWAGVKYCKQTGVVSVMASV